MTTRLAAVALLSLLAILAACGKGVTQKGTLYTVNLNRELETYLAQDLESVHKAAVKAVEAMGYTLLNDAIDRREALIEAETATKRPVRVKLVRHGDNITATTVYVGGDEVAARELLDRIEA